MTDKLKTLIVEDDKSLLDLYNIALADDIFEKRLVADGKEAMEIYKTWHPDIIILDLLLPNLSGHSVLNNIREKIEDEETTIIVSTSSDYDEDMKSCKMAGIQGYIVKPFKPRNLAGEVLKYFSLKNPERAETALDQLA